MGQSAWVQDMDGHRNEADILLPAANRMEDRADLMIRLLEKLPLVLTKPIVIQHTQTIDERFTLTLHEAENISETLPESSASQKTN